MNAANTTSPRQTQPAWALTNKDILAYWCVFAGFVIGMGFFQLVIAAAVLYLGIPEFVGLSVFVVSLPALLSVPMQMARLYREMKYGIRPVSAQDGVKKSKVVSVALLIGYVALWTVQSPLNALKFFVRRYKGALKVEFSQSAETPNAAEHPQAAEASEKSEIPRCSELRIDSSLFAF